ncbi:hypothetical protein DF188_05865 [Aliarcobacter skirrowii]|uniref:Sulfotransferase family protein n=1 Tax=Aliarcobacter skirrowii TaxID=28200 RepID=A0A2U2C153_9BACT|nr:hypothetical protein [Aliarcobacter skirrowii]PWE21738.1 hypothetical protein DF188_05865 [Aliarcobacter skirrowii]
MKQTCILVLGMHRSGTSALTGTLGLLDIYLGKELLKAGDDNQKGYFENMSLYKTNEKILQSIDSSWDDMFYREEFLETITEINALKEAIKDEFGSSKLFAIKDPRLAYLFPLYERALNELDIDIKIIIPYRNPIEVANSLKKRNDMPPEKAMLLWAYSFLLSEKFSRKYDRVFTSFNELIDEPKNVVSDIAEKLSLNLIDKYNEKEISIKEFLEPNLKHHNISLADTKKNSIKIVKEILNLKDKFNTSDLSKEFDLLRDELFSYQKLFYNEDLRNQKQELNQTKQELNQTKQELNQTKQELNQTKQELNQTKQELNQTKQELLGVYTSKSWKLTRPLRKIMRVLRGE